MKKPNPLKHWADLPNQIEYFKFKIRLLESNLKKYKKKLAEFEKRIKKQKGKNV